MVNFPIQSRMRTQLEDFLWSNSWSEQACKNWEHNGSGMFVKIKKNMFCDNILNACIGRKGTGFEMDLTWKLVKRNTGLCLDKQWKLIFLLYLFCMQYFHLRWNGEQSCPCTWSSQMIMSWSWLENSRMRNGGLFMFEVAGNILTGSSKMHLKKN